MNKRKFEQSSPSKRQKIPPSLGDPDRDYIREILLSDQFHTFMPYIDINDIWVLAWTCQSIYQRIRAFTEAQLLAFVRSDRPYDNTLCLHGTSSTWDARSDSERFKYNIRFVLYLRSRKLIGFEVCEQMLLKLANFKPISFCHILGIGCEVTLIEKLHSLQRLSFSRKDENGFLVFSSFRFSAKYLISITKIVSNKVDSKGTEPKRMRTAPYDTGSNSIILSILEYCNAIWKPKLIQKYFQYLEFLLETYPNYGLVVLETILTKYDSGLSIEQLEKLFSHRTRDNDFLHRGISKSEDSLFVAAKTGRIHLDSMYCSILYYAMGNIRSIRLLFRLGKFCDFYRTYGKDFSSKKTIIEIARLYKLDPSYGLEEYDKLRKLVSEDPVVRPLNNVL